MTTHLTSRRVALVAIGGLVAALSLSGIAQALTGTIFKYSTAKTGYFGIDVMALAPAWNGAADNYNIALNGFLTTTGVNLCFTTGVNLPQGAKMTQLAVWTVSVAKSDPEVYLFRHKMADGTSTPIAIKPIVSDSGTLKQTNLAIANTPSAVVNNASYTYGFVVCLGDGDKFHAARVAYTYSNAGD